MPPLVPMRAAKLQPITPRGQRQLAAERARLAAIADQDEAARVRVAWLDRILATIEVIAPTRVQGGAGFGCEIDLEDEDGQPRSYTLVGHDEVDAASGFITAESPVGRALLGRAVGDVIELTRAGRHHELTVVAVRVPVDDG